MTNEETIVELRDLISDDRTDKENEALLIAIEAVRNKRPHGKWIMNKTSAKWRPKGENIFIGIFYKVTRLYIDTTVCEVTKNENWSN